MSPAKKAAMKTAAKRSANMPTGEPDPMTQPQKRGWMLPIG